MFDFKSYPELKVYHKKWHNLFNNLYKYEAKLNKTGKEKNDRLWKLTYKEFEETEEKYAIEIFNILKDEKPLLNNYIDKKYEKWDDVVKKWKSKPINWVVSMVEESGGRYRLPAEYYLQKK